MLQERLLVREQRLAILRAQPVDGRAQSHHGGDVGCAGLEFVRRLLVRRRFERDRAHHFAAALPRLHPFEQRGAAVEDADAHRAVHLVRRQGIKIAAKFLHVDGQVRRGLRAVEQHRYAARMRELRKATDGIDGADRVRHVRRGDEPGPRPDQLFQLLEPQLAALIHLRDPKLHAEPLPRHEVRVVLQRGHHDLVAGPRASEGLRDQIHRLGDAAHEDDLVGPRGVDEALHCGTRVFQLRGGALGERMHAAVDVGIVAFVEAGDGVDDRARLLRSRRAVEVHQRLPVHALRERGKFAAHIHGTSSPRGAPGR